MVTTTALKDTRFDNGFQSVQRWRPMKKLIKSLIERSLGFRLVRTGDFDSLSDLSPKQWDIVQLSRPYTMTSLSRMAELVNAMDYVIKNGIPGDICECGVWRGGSMMIIAKCLIASGDTGRSLYLYDTFEGMSTPSEKDVDVNGTTADKHLRETPKGEGKWGTGVWCYASIEDVRSNLISTGYPADKIHFVKGKVEDTIPATLPSQLALLRLDTDWYESTKHELTHLFPLLSKHGIMIIDDYGAWQGARKAVDEYFAVNGPVFLHRVDSTGRSVVKF